MKRLIFYALIGFAILGVAHSLHAASDYTATAKEGAVIGDRIDIAVTVVFADKVVDGKTGACTAQCDLKYDRFVDIADWKADSQKITAQLASFIVASKLLNVPVNQAQPKLPDVTLTKSQVDAEVPAAGLDVQ